jgi:hypothetical protein
LFDSNSLPLTQIWNTPFLVVAFYCASISQNSDSSVYLSGNYNLAHFSLFLWDTPLFSSCG